MEKKEKKKEKKLSDRVAACYALARSNPLLLLSWMRVELVPELAAVHVWTLEAPVHVPRATTG